MSLPKTLLLFLMVVSSSLAYALPTAKISIKVIDEAGQPVQGANIGIGFSLPKGKGQGAGSIIKGARGLTDGNGLFTAKGESEAYVSFGVLKDGFYNGSGGFSKFTGTTGIIGFRKYKPWNPTVELVLKKKINPIPMYVYRLNLVEKNHKPELPMLGSFAGFDLMAHDWVKPYGQGVDTDMLIRVDVRRAISFQDHDVTLTIRFPNQGDGMIEYTPDISKGKSGLRLPHHAPSSGYNPEYTRRYENNPETRRVGKYGNPEYDTNYFFRIRTQLDKDGNVINGLYGKIHGEINLYNYTLSRKDKNPFFAFDYYLNPNEGDTNIEFDIDKNLFENLPDMLKVQNP